MHINWNNKDRDESIIIILNYGRRLFLSRDINDAVAYVACCCLCVHIQCETAEKLVTVKRETRASRANVISTSSFSRVNGENINEEIDRD